MKSRSVGLAALLLLATLTASCGGGGSGLIISGLIALFTPVAPSADPRISLEPGTAAGDVFRIEVHANGIDEIAGVAFTLLYDSAQAEYLSCEAKGSIFVSDPNLTNPCDGNAVGGARFEAALQNGTPGLLNIGAALDGLVAGVAGGDGLLLTLTFQATQAGSATAYDFEAGPSREVQTCDLTTCVVAAVNWDGGSLTSVSQ